MQILMERGGSCRDVRLCLVMRSPLWRIISLRRRAKYMFFFLNEIYTLQFELFSWDRKVSPLFFTLRLATLFREVSDVHGF
jgi:hypothetical protein